MPHTLALEAVPRGFPAADRICICGCRRSISHKRAGARFFNATCRQRVHRARVSAICSGLRFLCCRCGMGALVEIDVDGDLCCVRCGHHLEHVATPISGFDQIAWLMVTDGDGQPILPPARRRRPGGWRVAMPVCQREGDAG